MRTLSIDIETFSSVDIKKAGLFKYAQSEDFEILLFAYAFDDEEVKIIDLAQGEQLPEFLIAALCNKNVVKTAYNATFECWCLNKFWKTPVEQWQCTMIKALYCGYPAGLDATGKAMGLAEDKKKLASGKALIRKFCVPCKATKSNGGRTRNLPHHEPEQWELFKKYCLQDVVTEREIKNRLAHIHFPLEEQKLWELDVQMNARGVAIDKKLVDNAIEFGERRREELMSEAVQISGLDNPNSVSQLKEWIENESGEAIESLNKESIATLIESSDSDKIKRILEIRQELGKTSTKKYEAMANAVGPDGRVRGLLQFYGANRTGRWAGRLVQVQNLPRNYLETLEYARELVKNRKIRNIRVAIWKYSRHAFTINQDSLCSKKWIQICSSRL